MKYNLTVSLHQWLLAQGFFGWLPGTLLHTSLTADLGMSHTDIKLIKYGNRKCLFLHTFSISLFQERSVIFFTITFCQVYFMFYVRVIKHAIDSNQKEEKLDSSTQNFKAENKKLRQEHAFSQILELRKQNMGATTLNRIILNAVATFNDPLVTKSSMYYMLKKQNTLAVLNITEPVTPKEHDVTTTTSSDATTGTHILRVDHTPNSISVPMSSTGIEGSDTIGDIDVSHKTRTGGAAFVVNNAKVSSKELTKTTLERCKTIAATKYYNAKQAARADGTSIAQHTLTNIIHDVEVEYALKTGTLKKKTIANRVYKNNLTGFNKQHSIPLYQLEPLIATAILDESRRGVSMKKDEVIQLGKDLSHGTIHARRYNDFMKVKRPESMSIEEEHANLGNAWYRGFCKRYSSVLKQAKSDSYELQANNDVTKVDNI